MIFPETDDPGFQAFITGFFLPFLSAVLGYSIFLVRKIISNVNHSN
jgi:hypothetical protein